MFSSFMSLLISFS